MEQHRHAKQARNTTQNTNNDRVARTEDTVDKKRRCDEREGEGGVGGSDSDAHGAVGVL